jgi:hypothetical protein
MPPAVAEPLGEDGERAGRDVTIIGRGDHVLDPPDLREHQSRRRHAGTGRLILKRTGVLKPTPRMAPARRQLEASQDCSQGKILAGAINGAQDAPLGPPVRQTPACQPKPRGSEQGEHEPESASRPASRALSSVELRGGWRRSRRRCVGRDAEGGDRSLLPASRSRHGNDHRPISLAAQLLEDNVGCPSRPNDNSRGKLLNVRADSCAARHSQSARCCRWS